MITWIKHGNIWDTDCRLIIIPVNTVGVMGAGLAKQLKERRPEIYRLYKKSCDNGEMDIGVVAIYGSYNLTGLFPTKKHWRHPSKLAYVSAGLDMLATYLVEEPAYYHSVAIPALGCGHGGLDWNVVKPLMQLALANVTAPIEIYTGGR